MTDQIPIHAEVIVKKNGKEVARGKNLTVTAGLELIAGIIASSNDRPSHMAMGSSADRTELSQTDLQGTEHERVSATVSTDGRTLSYNAEFGSGIAASVSVREFGIFNDATAGTMLCRFVTTQINMSATDTLDVTWNLIFGEIDE